MSNPFIPLKQLLDHLLKALKRASSNHPPLSTFDKECYAYAMRNKSPMWVLALLGLGLFSNPVLGQNPTGTTSGYVARDFDLRQLATQPGNVLVSPNFLTLIQFEDLVDEVASARADLLRVEVRDNVILLRSAQNAGSTDLIVQSGGRMALFRIKIDAASFTSRLYRVRYPEPVPQLGSVNPVVPLSNAGIDLPLEPPRANNPPTLPTAPTIPASPQAPANPNPPSNPSTPAPRVEFAATKDGNTIRYTLINQSASTLTVDAARLRLSSGSNPVLFTISRVGGLFLGRLGPGETERGTIYLQGNAAEVELEWVLGLVGLDAPFTLRRSVR